MSKSPIDPSRRHRRTLAPSRVRDAATLFGALGEPTRLALFVRLAASGPGSIATLSAHVDVSRQAVTKHLNVLSSASLVRSERQGRERIWAVEPDRLADAHEYIHRIDTQWDAALARLGETIDGD